MTLVGKIDAPEDDEGALNGALIDEAYSMEYVDASDGTGESADADSIAEDSEVEHKFPGFHDVSTKSLAAETETAHVLAFEDKGRSTSSSNSGTAVLMIMSACAVVVVAVLVATRTVQRQRQHAPSTTPLPLQLPLQQGVSESNPSFEGMATAL
jgi:hypothetical protein